MRQLSLERSANLTGSKAIITTQRLCWQRCCELSLIPDGLASFEKKRGQRLVFGKNCLGG